MVHSFQLDEAFSTCFAGSISRQWSTIILKHDLGRESTSDQALTVISTKLVALVHIMQFYSSDGKGNFLGKLQPVSQKAIHPTLVICPDSAECETMSCNPQLLLQATKTKRRRRSEI